MGRRFSFRVVKMFDKLIEVIYTIVNVLNAT